MNIKMAERLVELLRKKNIYNLFHKTLCLYSCSQGLHPGTNFYNFVIGSVKDSQILVRFCRNLAPMKNDLEGCALN